MWPLSWSANAICCFCGCRGLWDMGDAGRAVLVCTAPAVGLQHWLWGYRPACPMAACQLPQTHPKTPVGTGAAQHWYCGRTSPHPERWEGVPHIPFPLTRWDEGTDVLGLQ